MHREMFICSTHLNGQNDLLKCFLALKAFKDKLVIMFHAISKHLKHLLEKN